MLDRSWRLIALAVVLGIQITATEIAVAGDVVPAQCADCNCQCACQKVCRLEREEKKIPVTRWGCQSEDFCLPGPSCQGCRNCEEVCAECDPEVQSATKTLSWYHWIPGRPKGVATKKKLMKKTVTKIVPSFKWVVVDLCPHCFHKHVPPELPADAKVPPPPKQAALGRVLPF